MVRSSGYHSRLTLGRSAVASFGGRLAYLGLQLGTQVVVAHRLGVANYGRFQVALTWVLVIAGVCQAGLHRIPLRYSVRAWAIGEDDSGLASFSFAWWRTVVLGTAGSLALLLASRIVPSGADGLAAYALSPLALVVLPVNLLTMIGTVTTARQDPFPDLVAAKVVQPTIFLFALLTVPATAGPSSLTSVAWFFAASWIAALVVGYSLTAVRHGVLGWRVAMAGRSNSLHAADEWWRTALQVHGADVLYRVRSLGDVLIAGAILPASAVGLYSMAARLGGLLVIFLDSVNTLAAGLFAANTNSDSYEALRRDYREIALSVGSIAAIPAGLFVGGGANVLGFFGESFSQGAQVLAILAFGQLISCAAGPSEYLLVVLGRQTTLLRAGIIVTVGLLVAGTISVKVAGPMGLAFVSSSCVVAYNVLQLIALRDTSIPSTLSEVARRTLTVFLGVIVFTWIALLVGARLPGVLVLAATGAVAVAFLMTPSGRRGTLWDRWGMP